MDYYARIEAYADISVLALGIYNKIVMLTIRVYLYSRNATNSIRILVNITSNAIWETGLKMANI